VSSRSSSRSLDTRALLLRRVEYGESDLVLALFTEKLGRVSALARGARRSAKRFGGSLEAMHTLSVRCDDREHTELLVLRESQIVIPRSSLVSDLERMLTAGRALAWVRRAAPPRTPEPEVWETLEKLLDRLSDRTDSIPSAVHLAAAGLGLLAAFGWGLDFSQCVRCGKPCPAGSPAMLDATRGGLVCRACGGARLRVEAAVRARLAHAGAGVDALEASDAELALDLVDQAMRAHAGFE